MILFRLLGSPPPTRGTLHQIMACMGDLRITPAYAGNTSKKVLNVQVTGDHPRLRGEHVSNISTNEKILGSPPPTRGTRKPLSHKQVRLGITPAYAGNTCIKIPQRNYGGDHPRLRGEHSIPVLVMSFPRGSPPPTRGTQYHLIKKVVFARITPAYAGNTAIRLANKHRF